MRVLHLISSGGMYGAEAVILNLLAELNGTDGNASYLGVFSSDLANPPALHVAALGANLRSTLIPCRGQVDLSVARSIRELISQTRADVVHAHGYKADIYTFLALRSKSRTALVSTCHTWYDNDLAVRAYGAADRWVLRCFDEVVAVSAEVEGRLLRAGVSEGKVRKIRNGIDVRPFSDAATAREYRSPESGRLRVGLVGRLAPEKGVDLFLKAVASIASRVPATDFLVAGDGPDRPALEILLRELGLEGRARLVGPQGSMPEFYASLDILVSASRQEGLPMALLEGMASGLPVVATRVGDVPSLMDDKQTGLLVEPGSPAKLSEAVMNLLEDPTRREQYGRAGQQKIIAEFSAQHMAAEYVSVYQRALSRRTNHIAARERTF